MSKNNYLTRDQYNSNKIKELPIKNIDYDNSLAPYFSEHIRRQLEDVDKDLGIKIYEDGLNINTTLDMSIQKIVEKSFDEVMIKNQKIFNESLLNSNNKLKKLSKSFNITIDSLKTILSGSVTIPNEFRKKLLVQGSVVVMDTKSGHILSMIGGRNEPEYLDHFNRATQAKGNPVLYLNHLYI